MAEISANDWAQLSPLLDELLDAPLEARAHRLAQIRRDDQALAIQLETLLAERTAIERDAFLEGSAFSVVRGPSLSGQALGAYTLREQVGQGGMGSVWRAERSDGRYQGTVAVKFLNLALLAHGGAERFAREGDMLARLSHPNIARLLDAGVAASNQPYLVLEYIDGVPIDAWCDARNLGIEARLRLFLDVLAAVAHAHSNLILHRDLKPSNILVTAQGQVKLLDFGIGKLIEDQTGAASPSELTQLAGRAFTPDFAAPEQLTQGNVTTATDVYTLGVLLYLLLVGRHPTAQPAHTQVDRLRAVVEDEPLRPSEAVATEAAGARAVTSIKLAHALRGDLDNIVARALKKSSAERYQTVSAFADDLRRHLNHEPISARRDALGYRIAKFVRRNRLAVGAASALLVTLLAGVVGTSWQALEARRERDAALFQAERALAQGNLFNLLLGALGGGDRPLTQREILGRSVDLVEKQFGTRPRIAVDLLLPIAGHYMTLGDADKELDAMQRAAKHAAMVGDPGLIAGVACNTVDTEVRRNQLERARAHLQAGLSALATIAEPDPGNVIACLRGEIEIARATGDLDRALERTRDGLALAERTGRTKGNTYPMLLSYLRLLHRDQGDLAASIEVSRRMQRLEEQMGRADTMDHLASRAFEARVLVGWGEYRAALAIVESLLPRWRHLSADGEPPPRFDNLRGELMLCLGDWSGAQRVLASAAARSRARGNVDEAVASEFVLAQALLAAGRPDESESLLTRVEAERPSLPGRYHAITPATVRAQLALTQGNLAEAARMIEDELARLGLSGGKSSFPLAAALRVATQVDLASGQGLRAEANAKAATEVAERLARDPAESAHVGEALLLLARAQRLQRKDDESAATARRAMVILAASSGNDHPLTRDARDLAGH
ncbi:MAG: protein kinase [Pseudomonadota bacterium]|nr:protein kinase [Pseudomonadota bacterium]